SRRGTQLVCGHLPGAGKPDRVRQAVDLSGFRGAALNQSQCASAVYTGLLMLALW
ncbi:hypothetical protein XT50_004693, partial [Salmonella enterica subsp. salamae]|nr:hypothetical protein [Salmonella enterica subsp. salamae]